MTHWRMQLHPADPRWAGHHAVHSLAAGFIGLDFENDVGDLTRASQSSLPPGQRDYWAFAHEMQAGDRVLIVLHHFPFALATVKGDYNYIRTPEPEIGVWFRHFRRIDRAGLRYFADRVTNAREWEPIKMTDTISPLRNPATRSYRLIEEWTESEASQSAR